MLTDTFPTLIVLLYSLFPSLSLDSDKRVVLGMRALSSLLVLAAIPAVLAVKSHDFKTCSQAGFCRRGRALSARAAEHPSWTSPYSIDASSVALSSDQASFTAAVKSSIYPEVKFGLDVRIHDDGVLRVRMDEVDGLRKHYDEAASWALLEEPKNSKEIKWNVGKEGVRAVYGPKSDIQVDVSYEPLKVTLRRDGKEQVVLNGRGLLHLEHFRAKESVATPQDGTEAASEGGLENENSQQVLQLVNPAAWFEGDSEDGWWEETFNSFTDPKPKGKSFRHSCRTRSEYHDRARITLGRSRLPQPWSCLRYPSTCNASGPPNYHRGGRGLL